MQLARLAHAPLRAALEQPLLLAVAAVQQVTRARVPAQAQQAAGAVVMVVVGGGGVIMTLGQATPVLVEQMRHADQNGWAGASGCAMACPWCRSGLAAAELLAGRQAAHGLRSRLSSVLWGRPNTKSDMGSQRVHTSLRGQGREARVTMNASCARGRVQAARASLGYGVKGLGNAMRLSLVAELHNRGHGICRACPLASCQGSESLRQGAAPRRPGSSRVHSPARHRCRRTTQLLLLVSSSSLFMTSMRITAGRGFLLLASSDSLSRLWAPAVPLPSRLALLACTCSNAWCGQAAAAACSLCLHVPLQGVTAWLRCSAAVGRWLPGGDLTSAAAPWGAGTVTPTRCVASAPSMACCTSSSSRLSSSPNYGSGGRGTQAVGCAAVAGVTQREHAAASCMAIRCGLQLPVLIASTLAFQSANTVTNALRGRPISDSGAMPNSALLGPGSTAATRPAADRAQRDHP